MNCINHNDGFNSTLFKHKKLNIQFNFFLFSNKNELVLHIERLIAVLSEKLTLLNCKV